MGPSDLQDVIAHDWGYTTFRPLQREAMDAVLAGRDSIVLPTGGGKSLCFQAPSVVRPGVALVVSPLISLMKDQLRLAAGQGWSSADDQHVPVRKMVEIEAGLEWLHVEICQE
jgi:ATP-dependent DNA helicase RecQ